MYVYTYSIKYIIKIINNATSANLLTTFLLRKALIWRLLTPQCHYFSLRRRAAFHSGALSLFRLPLSTKYAPFRARTTCINRVHSCVRMPTSLCLFYRQHLRAPRICMKITQIY